MIAMAAEFATINPNMLWNISTNKVPALLPSWITLSTKVIAKFSIALITSTAECAREAPIQATECPKAVSDDIKEAAMVKAFRPTMELAVYYNPFAETVSSQVRHWSLGVASQTRSTNNLSFIR